MNEMHIQQEKTNLNVNVTGTKKLPKSRESGESGEKRQPVPDEDTWNTDASDRCSMRFIPLTYIRQGKARQGVYTNTYVLYCVCICVYVGARLSLSISRRRHRQWGGGGGWRQAPVFWGSHRRKEAGGGAEMTAAGCWIRRKRSKKRRCCTRWVGFGWDGRRWEKLHLL